MPRLARLWRSLSHVGQGGAKPEKMLWRRNDRWTVVCLTRSASLYAPLSLVRSDGAFADGVVEGRVTTHQRVHPASSIDTVSVPTQYEDGIEGRELLGVGVGCSAKKA